MNRKVDAGPTIKKILALRATYSKNKLSPANSNIGNASARTGRTDIGERANFNDLKGPGAASAPFPQGGRSDGQML